MYKYRVTRLGKFVLSILISIILLITYTINRAISVNAESSVSAKIDTKSYDIRNLNLVASDDDTKKYIHFIGVDNRMNKEALVFTNSDHQGAKEEKDSSDSSAKNDKNETLKIPVEQVYSNDVGKIAFLTFDDGPSRNITPQILDILDRYDVKATFFVLGNLCANNSDIIYEIVNRGHAIGIHTYSHNYELVYANADNFIKELRDTDTVLKKILGEKFQTRLFRFPGGSFLDKAEPYKEVLKDEGYVYIDWNSLTGDGEALNVAPEKLLERLKDTVNNKQHLVVLMHDSSSKQTTVQALPHVIDYLKSQGYEFAILK